MFSKWSIKNVSSHSHNIPCSSGKPESRTSIVLELGIVKGRLVTCDAPELLAVSGSKNSFESDKEFALSCNSCIWVIIDSQYEESSVASWTIRPFLPVALCHFLHSNDIVMQPLIGNALCCFLGIAYSSFPILRTK